MTSWSPRSLPDLSGKTFAVTGGSSGIGYFVCEQLAGAGASVVILARSKQKADVAIAAITGHHPSAQLAFIPFDLDSLESVRAAAKLLPASLDGLALNAGLIWPPKTREVTSDGLEKMVGSNFVGHFAFVAAALGHCTPTASIVSMGSMATRTKRADFGDLMQERSRYDSALSYPNSKHAVQVFGFELDRRLRASGRAIRSIVVHPGFALDAQAPRRAGVNDLSRAVRLLQSTGMALTQGKHRGAWPMLRALVDVSVEGGAYLGPRGGLKGAPVAKIAVAQDRDPETGDRLWKLAQQWAGVKFEV